MEDKKAVELLKHHIKTWKGKFAPLHFEACKLGIEALEKQMPSKTSFAGGRYVCKCGWDIYRDGQKYCLNCGQKLDWQEGE